MAFVYYIAYFTCADCRYPIDHRLSGRDWDALMLALSFHPRRDEKIGCGAQEIMVPNTWKI